jgi:hypothetical protein
VAAHAPPSEPRPVELEGRLEPQPEERAHPERVLEVQGRPVMAFLPRMISFTAWTGRPIRRASSLWVIPRRK